MGWWDNQFKRFDRPVWTEIIPARCAQINLLDVRTRSNKVPEVFPPPIWQNAFICFFFSGETTNLKSVGFDWWAAGVVLGARWLLCLVPCQDFFPLRIQGQRTWAARAMHPGNTEHAEFTPLSNLELESWLRKCLQSILGFTPRKGSGEYAAVSFLPNYAHITGFTSASVFSLMTKQFYKSI